LRGVWFAFLILRMVITPPLTTKKSKIRTHDHALTTIDPKNQRFEPTTMHFYTTIDQKSRFEPTTMHYTTTDPQKSKIRPKGLPLPPLTSTSQRFEPKTMHYTTIDQKRQRFEPKTLHSPACTTPLLTTKAVTFFRPDFFY
jgi:hypothetical protein